MGKLKYCIKCETFKDKKVEFSKCSITKDGLHSYCKTCMKEYHRKWNINNKNKRSTYRQENQEMLAVIKKKHRHKHPQREIARRTITYLLKKGKLIPEPCEYCDSVKNPETHHPDYNKPFEIRWLCVGHHHDLHAGRINLKPAKDLEIT